MEGGIPRSHPANFLDPDEITPPGTPDPSRALLNTSFTSPDLWSSLDTPPNSQITTTYATPELEDQPQLTNTPDSSPRETTFTTPGRANNLTSEEPPTPPNSQPRPPLGDSNRQDKLTSSFHLATPPATATPRRRSQKFVLPPPQSPLHSRTTFPFQSSAASRSSPTPSSTDLLCSKCISPLPASSPLRSSPLPCNHTLCPPCVRKLFRYSLYSSRFRGPPLCCSPQTPLPLATIGSVAKPAEFAAYCDKLREHHQPSAAGRKMYCHRPDCGMYINVWNQRTCSGTCPKCGERTCRICGRRAHMFGILGVVGGGGGGGKMKNVRKRDGKTRPKGGGRSKGRVLKGIGMCPAAAGGREMGGVGLGVEMGTEA